MREGSYSPSENWVPTHEIISLMVLPNVIAREFAPTPPATLPRQPSSWLAKHRVMMLLGWDGGPFSAFPKRNTN